ncbi:MAG TPA: cytochrome c3 family protein [Gemmataceae bacterium]|nr:cytochrome c3 family protein [Gemmataceae bacterium]
MPQIFSPRADFWFRQIALFVVLATAASVGATYYYASARFTRVGYQPDQPVSFSHKQHVGEIGLDCRYCHTQVETSPHATIPGTQICMNCHSLIKTTSPALSYIRDRWDRDSLKTDKLPAAEWKRIHRLPDYAYFNHAVHVNRGVDCVICHGKLNEMKVVREVQPLTMGWCLQCHREPELQLGAEVKEKLKLRPPETCQACHR